MSTIATIAREYNSQPYEIAAFFALGTDYDENAEIDEATETEMREALAIQADLSAE